MTHEMTITQTKFTQEAKTMDHRTKVAEKKRLLMRTKLIDATMRVFAEHTGPTPVIDDVIRP